jgi:hypothetical protein
MNTKSLIAIAALTVSVALAKPSYNVEVWQLTEPPIRQSGDGTAHLIRAILWSSSNTEKAYFLLSADVRASLTKIDFSQEVVKQLSVSETSTGSGLFRVTLGEEVPLGCEKVEALIAAAQGDKGMVVIPGAALPYRIKTKD